ncbi:M3 family metallopeptidase [Prevotella sp. E13-27]|uniref:M3 family metallopeptidase n=1 Tax=Prevotella sp. E13-27 TaxID=2938122 RepID=UPI00200A9055|nr:M3 family metallopeptidase [Prevotella sp. E13-27]MCK8623557.1 M3 family metallopeptidase [Prevotella sp. E13-27]
MDNNTQTEKRVNPFFEQYNTPHDTVPFDKIRLEDYEEAFMEGIRRDNEQIDKTINNPAKPTFDNTIIDKDDDTEGYYDLLERVSTVFFNLLSAETNDEMDALAQKMQPILTQHANDVRLNERLFERIKYVHRHHRKLTPEEKMLLEKTYQGFVRSGALLSPEDKDKLRKLTEEASMLSLQFSQNLLKETKAFTLHVTDEKQLDGLPQTAIDAAAQTAKEQEKEGWVFTLDYPSYSPFMTYSTQRDLREQMYMARNTLCTHANSENNIDICKRLVNLRREIAQLLGYKTYADYVLVNRMASNVKSVYKLLYDLIDAYKPTAEKELAEIKKSLPSSFTKGNSKEKETSLMPWDTSFYSHKLQLKKYNIDAEMLRPYFELSKVIEGVFGLANRLYGITFKENKDIPVYHPDVKAYEVFDRDGSYLAVFYADFHPRKGKQGGAWMTEYQGQFIDKKGENVRPHVSVVMNLTKPTAEKPALLTLGEVETFLHEFGHSLHGMFANTRFESLSGTNVWWDFVELPSQFMENFSIEKEFLRTFAFHYETGEPLPDELIDRIVKSRNFMCATACLRQVSFGLLDMAYYTQRQEFTADVIPFEKEAWKKAILGKQLTDTCMTVQFSHIMAGGYAAGYYSYKWAEVLDADAFSVFKKHGIFDQKTAQSFRDNILSKGGTEHPMTLYKRFRGGEPTIDALLRRNGIKRRK